MTAPVMLSHDMLLAFFGWCSVINVIVLVLAALSLMLLRNLFMPLHAKMFGASEEALSQIYLQYLAGYKILVIVFNIVPWIALKLIA